MLGISVCHAKAQSRVIIAGNKLFEKNEIWSLIEYDCQSGLTDETARTVKRKVLEFYHEQGYDLARVWSRVHEKNLYIVIEEGRLEKTLYYGRGSAITLAMHLLIKLQENVYNRKDLLEELNRVKSDLSIRNIYYEIKFCEYEHTVGELLGEGGDKIFPDKFQYFNLHVHMLSMGRGGPGFGLDYFPAPGIVPFIYFKGKHLIDENDNYLLQAEGGINVRKSLVDDQYKLLLTHAKGWLRYESKPFFHFFRIITDDFIDLSSSQRSDLPLDEYWQMKTHVSLHAGFQVHPSFMISFGGGVEHINIFSLTPLPKDPFDIEPFRSLRGFGEARLEIDFDPKKLRIDKHDCLTTSYQMFTGMGQFHRVFLRYWKFFKFGNDDLYMRLKALTTLGDPRFHDEMALGGLHMRTFHGGKFYVDHAAWLSLEYRFSILRERIKLSVFHDASFFGRINRKKKLGGRGDRPYEEFTETTEPAFANAFGPGFHWLFYDTFQWDVYLSGGWSPEGFSWNTYLRLNKVFF